MKRRLSGAVEVWKMGRRRVGGRVIGSLVENWPIKFSFESPLGSETVHQKFDCGHGRHLQCSSHKPRLVTKYSNKSDWWRESRRFTRWRFTNFTRSMSQSLSPECTPLKQEYDSCFNSWFEGYLEPAVAASLSTEARMEYSKQKAEEFEEKCGKIWKSYRSCVQVCNLSIGTSELIFSLSLV